jgi:20S proteasome alpha/beta subunit
MTIALGLLSGDGVVLAADTQYTSGNLKTSGPKVFAFPFDGSVSVILAGAGNVGLLHKAAESIEEFIDVAITKEAPTNKDIRDLVETVLDDIYSDHIAKSIEKLELDIILGVWTKQDNKLSLYQNEVRALYKVEERTCVGYGADVATYVIDLMKGGTVADNTLVAVNAVRAAKEYSEYCGKETVVHVLRRDGTQSKVDDQRIKHLEDYFAGFTNTLKVFLMGMDPTIFSDDEIGILTEFFKEGMLEFREKERARLAKRARMNELKAKRQQEQK